MHLMGFDLRYRHSIYENQRKRQKNCQIISEKKHIRNICTLHIRLVCLYRVEKDETNYWNKKKY